MNPLIERPSYLPSSYYSIKSEVERLGSYSGNRNSVNYFESNLDNISIGLFAADLLKKGSVSIATVSTLGAIATASIGYVGLAALIDIFAGGMSYCGGILQESFKHQLEHLGSDIKRRLKPHEYREELVNLQNHIISSNPVDIDDMRRLKDLEERLAMEVLCAPLD